MEILVRDQALRNFFTEVFEAYQDLRPEDAAAFRKHVEAESQALVKPSGMSREGHFLNRMYIPSILYSFIKAQARKRLEIDDIWRDRRHYDLLCSVVQSAETRRVPTEIFHGVAPCHT